MVRPDYCYAKKSIREERWNYILLGSKGFPAQWWKETDEINLVQTLSNWYEEGYPYVKKKHYKVIPKEYLCPS